MRYDWDATTYDDISKVIESWGLDLLERRKWRGNEVILDAGCGSGRLTKIVSTKVPSGRVIAVDMDPKMINLAAEKLACFHNIQFIHKDISNVELAEKVNVVFSNAVLHWISDHRKVFEHFWKILKPNGQLLIQCGGHSNLKKSKNVFDNIRKSERFSRYFSNDEGKDVWKDPWHFAKKEDTESLLKDIGFTNIDVFSESKIAKFKNKREYSLYLKTIVLRPYLEYFPSEELKDKFIESVTHEIETNAKTLKWNLDYVRLNITASRGM